MKKIIYTRPDGGMSVVHPAPHRGSEEIPEEQAVQRAWAKLPADAINPLVVDESAILSDRTYRNAWEKSGAAVGVNMPKAREIHRQKMREARKPKLEALDIEQLRGRNVEAQKQALRDVTAAPEIESASTPDDLKAVWPDCLK